MPTIVESKICAHCGADIRPDTLFCYSCGSSVAPETVVALKDKNEFDGRTNISESPANGSGVTTKLRESKIENITDKPIPAPTTNDSELKSAAAMRRKSKIYQPKRTEIIWEDRGNSVNVWFFITTIIITLLAAGIFYLAIYLK